MEWSLKTNLAVAAALRLLLICYGRIHDTLFEVRFTDIDYVVFTDAARYVVRGRPPYDRYTYRYSPIIAWILTPAIWMDMPEFGKVLFTVFDLFSAFLVYKIVLRDTKGDERKAIVSACMLLYNPLNAVISARGNAESLLSSMVLLTCYLLVQQELFSASNWLTRSSGLILASIVHGMAIHMKIYPVIYLPTIFLHFAGSTMNARTRIIRACLTNTRGIVYGFVCTFAFAASTFLCYRMYGRTYLDEAILYHISRRDVKHNFSPHFYPMYLMQDNPELDWTSVGAFLPQVVLISFFSWHYKDDLQFGWFACTFAFVSFNKVCTSQYFVWYLTLLPLIWYKLRLRRSMAVKMLLAWCGAQAVWLALAYLLEFKGWDVFVHVWLASLAFLIVNCWILTRITYAYSEQRAVIAANTADKKAS